VAGPLCAPGKRPIRPGRCRLSLIGSVLVLVLAMVAGCQSVPTEDDAWSPRRQPPPYVPAFVTVEPGDTVYGLAQQYQVPMQAIIDLNNLTPPYHLLVGQYLKMPRVRFYAVRPGDTLSTIAEAHAVNTLRLANLNKIEPPYLIRVGEWLRLPNTDDAREPPAPDIAEQPIVQTPAAIAAEPLPPLPGNTQTDETGDPPPARSDPNDRPTMGVEALAALNPSLSSDPPTGEAGANDGLSPSTPPMATVELAYPRPPHPPAQKTGRFGWPARGPILAGFGPQADGQHNDGINIAVQQGTPVRAADYGVVAYAGNELRGFGNLVLIRHQNGWITAYGHLNAYTVSKGDHLRRGQVIGDAGQSGAVNRPQLHFELRKGRQAVDPMAHLTQAVPLRAERNDPQAG